MMSRPRRLLSRLLQRLARSPRVKLLGQRLLSRFPRLRGFVLRLLHGGPLLGRRATINAFDARGACQQRLHEDLQRRWESNQ